MDEKFNSIEVPVEIDLVIESAIKEGSKKRKINRFKPFVAAAACFCIMVTGFAVYKNIDNDKDKVVKSTEIKSTRTSKLPTVDSYENLKIILKDCINQANTKNSGDTLDGSTLHAVEKSAKSNDNTSKEAAKNYSETNQQVKGVDEGDNVKTDGKYIYRITGNKLVIVSAVPAESLSITSQLSYNNSFIPKDMFIKDNYLIVMGNLCSSNECKRISDDLVYMRNQKTKIYIYDISDKKKPSQVREVELDGGYNQSRLLNSTVYVISNKNIPLYKGAVYNELPICKDSAIGNKDINIDYSNINYCPGALEPNYIMVGCINLDKINEGINITTVLGSGHNIYASENNLYVAGDNFGYRNYNLAEAKTTIYKFSLNKASTSFIASGEVKGNILNQFSMDESKGSFRIATTENKFDPNNSKNNMYVLNSEMKIVGSLEGLAPGERIYSTRFMGDRAYMVTFKQTDPLFVIDLKNPKAPKVLGELKIPGFSNYLEPYDDTHIMGFGQDTVDVNEGGSTRVRPIGMKIAMFDVTDVTHPIQQFETKIQGENSSSDVMYNHKALLFSKDKNLLAFPVNYYIKSTDKVEGYFQGAYVYNVDLSKGFILKGSITHRDILDSNNKVNLNAQSQIDREMYIGNTLYTISNYAIKANNLGDLKEISKLKINSESP